MFDLENIRVIEYLRLPEEQLQSYMELQKVMNAKDEFCGIKATPLGTLTFGQVAELKVLASQPSFDAMSQMFKMVFNVSKHQMLRAWVTDLFYAANWIQKALLKILENEKKVLGGDIDPLLIEAGIERLSTLRELPVLFEIGRQFGLDPEVIENWKYNKVFAIQAEGKIIGEVQREYQKLKYKTA